jgi:Ricin-type beta-trefoil lectin domain-like
MRTTAYLSAAIIGAATLALMSFSGVTANASTTASAAQQRTIVTAAQPDSSAPWAELKNYHSGKCLEVPESNKTAGTQLDQWTCNGTATQLWRPQRTTVGSDYVFINENSGQCINVRGYGKSNGDAIQQWPCDWNTATTNEIWYADLFIGNLGGLSYYEWAGVQSNGCLNVTGSSTANGAKVQLWTCIPNNSPNEWFAQPYWS